jgi:hypothetical protein
MMDLADLKEAQAIKRQQVPEKPALPKAKTPIDYRMVAAKPPPPPPPPPEPKTRVRLAGTTAEVYITNDERMISLRMAVLDTKGPKPNARDIRIAVKG